MFLLGRCCRLALALFASIPVFLWSLLPLRSTTSRRRARAEAARRLFLRFGGVFPKLAQIASTRVDVVPMHYRESFAQLRNGCVKEATQSFTSALGALSDEVTGVEVDPLGVGAIAQVHRAKLAATGNLLAIKAIKPRAARDWDADLRIARWSCHLLDPLTRRFGLSLDGAFADLNAALGMHRDLRDEAEAMQTVARACSENGLRVHIPGVVFAATCDLLAIEYLTAEQIDSRRLDPDVAKSAAMDAMTLLFRMIFDIGVVHCDLHPGNMLVDQNGQLVVLDFGGCRHISTRTRTAFRTLFASIGTRDGGGAAAVFLRMSRPRQGSPCALGLDSFCADVQALVDEVHLKRVSSFRVARFVEGIFRVHKRHGLVAGADFVAIILALLVFEGTALRLIPDANFQSVALSVLMDPWPVKVTH